VDAEQLRQLARDPETAASALRVWLDERPGLEIVESQGTRVPRACAELVPALTEVEGATVAVPHAVACHYPDDGTTYAATVAISGASGT
jgi:hypothetical protein